MKTSFSYIISATITVIILFVIIRIAENNSSIKNLVTNPIIQALIGLAIFALFALMAYILKKIKFTKKAPRS